MNTDRIHSSGEVVGGRYEINQYINEGGMQEVYEAHDHLLNKTVAIKVPKNQHARKRFARSAIVSARVNHSNVAKTLDYFSDDGRSYLVEEFIDGNDLSWILKNRFNLFDPLLVSWILHRIAKGVAASHHAGVVHRDLKPSNIMIEGGERIFEVKVTDFGIAKLAEEELAEAIEGGEESITASQTAIGALPYMAPELIEDIKGATPAVDVWSIGALTYELLTGKKPFGAGLRAVPAIQSKEPPEISSQASKKPQFQANVAALSNIISKCLQKNPNNRPSIDGLVDECEALCYPKIPREFGNIGTIRYNAWGFINCDEGEDVFFHVDSLYSDTSLAVGDRVCFVRHKGGGRDRAFPVVKVMT